MKDFVILDFQESDSLYTFLVQGINSYLINIFPSSNIQQNASFPFVNNEIRVFSYVNQYIPFNNEIFLHHSLKHMSIKNNLIKIQVFEDNINNLELLQLVLQCFNKIQNTNYSVKINDNMFSILHNDETISISSI